MARQPVVYILASPNGRALYIGVTTDLGRRLEEHRRGMSIHTAQYNITRLVYIEALETAPDAIAREKQLKKWRREKKIALIDVANPEWLDLTAQILQRLFVETRSLRFTSLRSATVETTEGIRRVDRSGETLLQHTVRPANRGTAPSTTVRASAWRRCVRRIQSASGGRRRSAGNAGSGDRRCRAGR